MNVKAISLDELVDGAPCIVVASTLDAALLACGGSLAAFGYGHGLRVLELDDEAVGICRLSTATGTPDRPLDNRMHALGACDRDRLFAPCSDSRLRFELTTLANRIAELSQRIGARSVFMPSELSTDVQGGEASALPDALAARVPGLRSWWYNGASNKKSGPIGVDDLMRVPSRSPMRTFDASRWQESRIAALPRLWRRGADRPLEPGPERFRLA